MAPFRHHIFAAMWTAALVSNFGSLIQTVGASWMMTSLGVSADMVALVQSSNTLPILLFAIVAGAFADIYDRRIVMLCAQSLMLFASVVLAVATGFGLIGPWTLLAMTFLVGTGQAMHGPSWQASVGEQVPREEIAQAVSLNSLSFNIARSAGPAVGGLIVAAFGAMAAFVVNAVTYVGLIAVLIRWRRPRPLNPFPPEGVLPAIRAGVQYVRRSPPIRAILLRGLAFGLSGSAIWALLPLVARDLLHGSATTYGVMLGAMGVGAVAGALSSSRLRSRLSTETAVRIYAAAISGSVLATALSRWPVATFAALMVVGGGWILTISTCNISVQLASPRWVVGRALSLFQMSVFGGMAVGSWVWGHIADAWGVPAALCGSAVALLGVVAMGLRLRLEQVEKVDLEPARAASPPDIAIPPGMEASPIVLTVEYRIEPGEAAAFLEAMVEKRRIRERDGARRWTLMQDLADPYVWIERFQNPNWNDYLRLRSRGAVADRAIEERVRAFHRGEGPPRVRRWVEHRPTADLHGPVESAAQRDSHLH